jgi:hypothetical protein
MTGDEKEITPVHPLGVNGCEKANRNWLRDMDSIEADLAKLNLLSPGQVDNEEIDKVDVGVGNYPIMSDESSDNHVICGLYREFDTCLSSHVGLLGDKEVSFGLAYNYFHGTGVDRMALSCYEKVWLSKPFPGTFKENAPGIAGGYEALAGPFAEESLIGKLVEVYMTKKIIIVPVQYRNHWVLLTMVIRKNRQQPLMYFMDSRKDYITDKEVEQIGKAVSE